MADAPDDTYVITIQWDAEGKYVSPPIGPFWVRGEATRAATRIRKALRAAGRPWHDRVKLHRVVTLDRAVGWASDPSRATT